MTYSYDLTLGLPHTNHRGLSEPLLLMHAGHFQWQSISAAIGSPLARLRTVSGGEVYAAFYYIEERLPDTAPLESFRLDDVVRFHVELRSFKNIAVEGRIVFDHAARLAHRAEADVEPRHPFIRFGNIFITPVKGNSVLRVAPPATADFSAIPPLSNDDNPYHITRAAIDRGELDVLDAQWQPFGSFDYEYRLDVDRDTNGAGLVYFANYVAFMDSAERRALDAMALPAGCTAIGERSLRHRRIAYYGNADVDDEIVVRVTALQHGSLPQWIGLRFAIVRQEDQQTICLSEAIKVVPGPA